MRLILARAALKDLRRVPRDDRKRVEARLEKIAEEPFASHGSVKPLQGEHGLYRLRVGDWRAIYHVDHKADAVHVLRVRHRREVYK